MTAGVPLTGIELAQPAGVKRGALTEPVLGIAKRVHIEGEIIMPEVKMDHDIAARPDASHRPTERGDNDKTPLRGLMGYTGRTVEDLLEHKLSGASCG